LFRKRAGHNLHIGNPPPKVMKRVGWGLGGNFVVYRVTGVVFFGEGECGNGFLVF